MATDADRSCPFCSLPKEKVLASNAYAFAFYDGFPVSPGHALIVPKQHVGSLFELPEEVQAAVWGLVAKVRVLLIEAHHPDSFNLGLNDGPDAGQTIGHAHVHLIPRYRGDLPDPRGGVRWIIPSKVDYWSEKT